MKYQVGDILRISDFEKYRKIKHWEVLEDVGYYAMTKEACLSMRFEVWEIVDSSWPFGKKKYKINRCDQSFLDKIKSKDINRKHLVFKMKLSEKNMDELFACDRVTRESKLNQIMDGL